MEEEGTEPEDESEDEEEEARTLKPRKSRKMLVIGVIIAVAALVGGVTAYVLLRNSVPTADFAYTAVDLHLAVNAQNSTDADGDTLTYTWDWGDASATSSGLTASHDYATVKVYTVTLTVQDGRGGVATGSKSITIQILPTAFFVARQYGMTTQFDATGSTGSPGHAVTNFAWAFGDGATGTGATATHTYGSAGRYTASLTVTDNANLANTASRYVSANTTTVDVLGSQFFASSCPYQDYWYLRHNTYGDVIINSTAPCRDYYPWILYSTSLASQNPSWVYSLWRMDILATNNFGYSVANPVYLPVFNSSAAPSGNSYIDMNLTFNYLNRDNNMTDPLNINYWDTTAYPVSSKYSDGFGYLVQGNLTMDLQESRRVFGVGDPVPFSPTANFTSQWANPANAFVSNDLYASSNTTGAVAYYGDYSVPQIGSIVQSVQVGVEGYTKGSDQVQLAFSTDGGTTWQVAGNVSLTSTDTTTYIDVTSLRSWTPALLSNANFQVRIQYTQVGGTNRPLYVDWLPIRVKTDSVPWWWAGSTKPAGPAGPLEVAMGRWLDGQGNGPYDIFNGFQWYYEADITDLNATIAPDGTTTVHVFMDGWGYDVLFARWSYWGSTNYSRAVTSAYGAYQPKGWLPFETCWCENATINATIRQSLDMHFAATSEYWFGAVGNAGKDGRLGTADDLPGWAFSPTLMDYVPPAGSGLTGASAYPHSELAWYTTQSAVITSPGSWGYGTQYEYMVVPDRWNMSLGNTLTLIMPNYKIPWYDPVKSTWNSVTQIGVYVTYNSLLTLRTVGPGSGYWLWDARGRVFSLAAPSGFHWPDSGVPLNGEPYIEFGPESTGP